MNQALVWVLTTLGSAFGLLHDPTTWVFLAVVAAFGFKRASWITFAAMVAFATALHIAAVYSWWVEVGLATDLPARILWQAWLKVVVGAPVFGCARALGLLVSRRGDSSSAMRPPE